MSRRELLERASQAIGYRVAPHLLIYALRQGHVSRPAQRADSWFAYSARNLDEFLAYLRNRSRRGPAAQ
jgi:hypothetical protein